MADTLYPRSMRPIQLLEENRHDQVAASAEWIQFQTYAVDLSDDGTDTRPWSIAAAIWADVDTGAEGSIRLRIGSKVLSTTEALISGPVANAQLGFLEFSDPTSPLPETLVFLEGRRTSQANGGGVHLLRAGLMVMSQPPAALIGGPFYPAGYVPGAQPYPPMYTTAFPYGN